LGLSPHSCPSAMAIYPRIISLPLYPAMTEDQVYYVAQAVKDIVRAHRTSAEVFLSEAV